MQLGSSKQQLDTPALCIDLDALEANIDAMMGHCRRAGVDWRPHSKCHKSPHLAHKLVEAGAIGVTCAKLGEAEVMAAAGIRDLLIANMIVGPLKVARLVELCRIADPIVCVDAFEQAEPMSRALAKAGLSARVILEVDIGLHRVGIAPGEPALELAQRVAALPGLRFAGIMGYEGHTLLVNDREQKAAQIRESLDWLGSTKELLERNGLKCEIVSAGGTGSFEFAVDHPAVTEIQAGGGIFMDEFYRNCCHVDGLKQSLTVLCTVTSRPAPERAILDAGRKTMNLELQMPKPVNLPGAELMYLSAEHGALKLDASTPPVKIGDRIEFIPGYGDLTTVLHDQFFVFRGDRLEAVWPLVGRGRLQ